MFPFTSARFLDPNDRYGGFKPLIVSGEYEGAGS
jgi:hypothetical protein